MSPDVLWEVLLQGFVNSTQENFFDFHGHPLIVDPDHQSQACRWIFQKLMVYGIWLR